MRKTKLFLLSLLTASTPLTWAATILTKNDRVVRNAPIDLSGIAKANRKGVITCEPGLAPSGTRKLPQDGTVLLTLSSGILGDVPQAATGGKIAKPIHYRESCAPYLRLNDYLIQAQINEWLTSGLLIDTPTDAQVAEGAFWECLSGKCACFAYTTNRTEIVVNATQFLAVTANRPQPTEKERCLDLIKPPKSGNARPAGARPAINPEDDGLNPENL